MSDMTRKHVLISFLLVSSAHTEDAESLFVRRVWPLFQEKCLACHGNDEKKIKADYDMRTLESAIKGGESEAKALVPGKPEESPLYLASTRTHDDWEPMPPKEADKLKPEQVTWIKEWIAAGADTPLDELRLFPEFQSSPFTPADWDWDWRSGWWYPYATFRAATAAELLAHATRG